MNQETLDQVWEAGYNGDHYAQAIIAFWAYEGNFIKKDSPFCISILNELSFANIWAKELLHYILTHPHIDKVLENIQLSRQAISQISDATQSNVFALTIFGLLRYNEIDNPMAKEEGKELLVRAAQYHCFWAQNLLQEIFENESAPTANYNSIFYPEGNIHKSKTCLSEKNRQMRNNIDRSNGIVEIGGSPVGRFHYLENFHRNLERKSKYGVSLFECEKAINEACRFFGIPVPLFSKDLTDNNLGKTMFYSKNNNSNSFADDVITYNLKQLKELGVYNVDAFSLVITHECAHRILQNTTLPGRENGQWEQELCCDFFMGVRCGLDMLSFDALDNVRKALCKSPGSVTHPTGKLRYDVISYGITYVGYMDLIQKRRRSIAEYLQIFEKWRQEHAEEIRQAQIPFYE